MSIIFFPSKKDSGETQTSKTCLPCSSAFSFLFAKCSTNLGIKKSDLEKVVNILNKEVDSDSSNRLKGVVEK